VVAVAIIVFEAAGRWLGAPRPPEDGK